MRTYALENRGRAPLYEYLYRCIRGDILDGTLTAGERLPSKRALAEHLHISVMTVEGAYQQLEAELQAGWILTDWNQILRQGDRLQTRQFLLCTALQQAPAPSL